MTLNSHVISTGADGRLVGMTANDVVQVVDNALQSPRLVLHFHGGLVDEAKGRRIAESLLPIYQDAGAYPVFFVWRSGALDILRNNMLEIAREELFERLLRRLLGWAVGSVRAAARGVPAVRGAMRPTEEELDGELRARSRRTDPYAGTEPFAGETIEPLGISGVREDAGPGGALDLTPTEEASFLTEVESDQQLRVLLAGAVADRELQGAGASGGRGIPDVPPVPSRIDDDILAEIAEGAQGAVADVRGPFSMVALARRALTVLSAVLRRFRTQTDSGLYPTVVEEVLRGFYLERAGGALWTAMKKETLDTFTAGATDRGGELVIDRLARGLAESGDKRLTLVGHSTGAVFIDNLLTTVARGNADGSRPWPAASRFQVCFLAPACTTQHFAATLDAADDLVGRFRMFTMTDTAERDDWLAGAVYPRSMLYLISGLLERDRDASAVAPLLGLSRYLAPEGLDRLLASDLGVIARLAAVRAFSAAEGRVVLSPTAAGALDGAMASALHHSDFDDDELVRRSLASMIRTW